MNGVQTWGEAIAISLFRMWESFVSIIPSFIGALVVFAAGWVVAVALGKIVEKIMKTIKIDNAFQNIGWGHWFGDMGISPNASSFFGGIARWFLVLVFLMAATDILQLTQVTTFLNSILLYIPNVAVSVIILAIVFLVGNFAYSVVRGSTKAAGVMSATLLASVSKWSIIAFGVLAALLQLGIAESLVNTIFIGVIAMLSLAGGLAFGLGGKEEAALILRKLREGISDRHQ
jgi:hypothetical protein